MRITISLFLLVGLFSVFSLVGQAAESGDLIKCPDFSAVYLLEDDGKRWVFPNEKTYFTWYSDFDDIVDVTCDELADYQIGGLVTYSPGSRLLKLQSAPTVYAVAEGGVLHAIQSEDQARSLYGDDWASEIDDLPDGFWSAYTVGDPLEKGAIAETGVEIIEPELTYEGAYNGTLYATSEQIGDSTPIEDYMENLDRNGVTWFLGFFTFEDEPVEETLVISSGLGYVLHAVQEYPGRIVPYFNPGIGGEEIEDEGLLESGELADLYESILDASVDIVGNDFFQGIGELEVMEWSVSYTGEEMTSLVEIAEDREIDVMFHPVASKLSQVEDLVQAYPDMTFLIHMFRDDLSDGLDELIELLEENDNLYYSIDAAHIAHYNNQDILYDAGSASAFISQFDRYYDEMLEDAINDYEELVESVPDKVMWGTEAGPDYAFEEDVYDRLIKISRELIGAMDEDDQEGLAYENAYRVFGDGVTYTGGVEVHDTSDWEECSNDFVDSCDLQCEEDGEIDETCFQACLFAEECIDPLAEDEE